MAKTWVLDSDTKGTGARMVPLEDVLEKPAPKAKPAGPASKPKPPAPRPPREPRPKSGGEQRLTPLAPGQVRRKTTGEIGRVKAVDSRAGTVTVSWLRSGQTSTVPLSSVTRK